MSLYGFFESYLEETPELLIARASPTQNYEGLYTQFRNRVK